MLLTVVDLKVKPLIVAFCINIILQNQIICFDLQRLFSISVEQIARLKMRIKPDGVWGHWEYFLLRLDVPVCHLCA